MYKGSRGDYSNNFSIYALKNKHHRIQIENHAIRDELRDAYSIYL